MSFFRSIPDLFGSDSNPQLRICFNIRSLVHIFIEFLVHCWNDKIEVVFKWLSSSLSVHAIDPATDFSVIYTKLLISEPSPVSISVSWVQSSFHPCDNLVGVDGCLDKHGDSKVVKDFMYSFDDEVSFQFVHGTW